MKRGALALSLIVTLALVVSACGDQGSNPTAGSSNALVTDVPNHALRPAQKTEAQAEAFLDNVQSYGGYSFNVATNQPSCHGRDDEQESESSNGEKTSTYTSFRCFFYAQESDDTGHSFDLFVQPQTDGTWIVVPN